MDFLDPKKKRGHTIRLIIGYALMAVALGIATLILVFAASGYDLDPKTGTIVQNGLVFVDAHPESATVYLDSKQQGQTDTRLAIPAGQHKLELRRDGYRQWQREFELGGSNIKHFVYPFLFPQNMVMKDTEIYGNQPGMATESPDRRWLLVQQPGSLTDFEIIDLNTKNNPITTVNVVRELFSAVGPNHNLEAVEWATNNRHVLVKHIFDGGSEFVIIDRETPAASFNVNKFFEIPITSMTFRDKRFDQYYIHDANGGVLRMADTKDKQQLPAILNNVLTFRPYGANVILFATAEGAPAGKVNIKIRDNNKVHDIRQLPVSKTYLLDVTQFNGTWYVATGDDSDLKTYIYRDIFDQLRNAPNKLPLPTSVLRVKAPQYLSFSSNARFIALQGGSEFAIYDAEENDQYRYDTKLPLLPGQKAHWMDGHRLVTTSQDKVVVFDFDGTNVQTLSDANPAYRIFFNRDYDAMFTITNSRQVQLKPALVRTELRVLPVGQ